MLRDDAQMNEPKEEKTTGGDPSGDCGRAKDQRANSADDTGRTRPTRRVDAAITQPE